jgi:hypothetical protein
MRWASFASVCTSVLPTRMRAALGLQQAGDAAQDRRLARTGRADDRHGLTTMHVKIDALEHRVGAERQVQVAQADQGLGDGFNRRHNVAPGVG